MTDSRQRHAHSNVPECDCEESPRERPGSTPSRRSVLQGIGGLSLPFWFPRMTFGLPQSSLQEQRDVMVCVFLRGGADALNLVIPVGEFDQELVVVEKLADGTTRKREVIPVRFVPLTRHDE